MDVFNSGVDWITLTGTGVTGEVSPLEEAWFAENLVSEDWALGGYKGVKCSETGIRFGHRMGRGGGDEQILIASGANSHLIAGRTFDFDRVRCTRFDLQVTVYLDPAAPHLARNQYRELVASRSVGNAKAGRRKLSLVQSDTGETLYVGSRKGGRKFFRFYDKSHDYDAKLGTIWRQEVQFGRRFSNEAHWRYQVISEDERQDEVVGLVCAEFASAMGYSLCPRDGDLMELVPETKHEPGGIETKLRWMKECVRPVAAHLSNAGYYVQVGQAIWGND